MSPWVALMLFITSPLWIQIGIDIFRTVKHRNGRTK